MAYYDLHCADCGKDHFDVSATVAEKVEMLILCPECGSNRMEKIFSPVSVHVKSEAPSGCPNGHICGSGCRWAN